VAASFLRPIGKENKRNTYMRKIVDLENIIAVLLPDGNWHDVYNGSFKLDGYVNAEGGEWDGSKGLSTMHGATWIDVETGERLACPLSAIGGVKYTRRINEENFKH
jgi:hypothetical protein